MNRDSLIELIDSKGGLLQRLLAEECITEEEKLEIESADKQPAMNGKLLDIICSKHEAAVDAFVHLLQTVDNRDALKALITTAAGKI